MMAIVSGGTGTEALIVPNIVSGGSW